MKLSFTKTWTVILTLLALNFSALGVTPAHAATLTVSDCTAPSGNTNRLMEQITAAVWGDTINFSCSATITLTAMIYINKNLTIDGTGQTVTISGGGTVQVMYVDGASLTLNNLTIANGSVAGGPTGGGGIYLMAGTVIITNSTFSGNSTINNGGGIFQNGGTLIITNSTFSGNSAATGGGIDIGAGTLTITNSTFSGDSATGGSGGGIFFGGGTTTITNSTFSGNSASGGTGGGIEQSAGTVTLYNTIVANSISGGDCGGTITADSYNLDSDGSCNNATQKTTAEIKLGSLADNGGPAKTFALLAGSSAIDAGNDTVCAAAVGDPTYGAGGLDQRGVSRPQGAHCDIGSYELDQAPLVTNVSSTTANGTYKSGDTIAVTVTFNEIVNVTGTPQLTLETGAIDRIVNYTSGTGTKTLTFNYVVQAGDTSSDLDYVATTSLALNGGTIQDGTPNAALLTLASPGAANSLGYNKAIVIDTTAPTMAMTSLASDPTNTSPIAVSVTFSESVTGFTSGDIVPANGAVNNFAGSGTSYTFNLTPAGQGLVTANIAAGVATDLAGNGNTIATQFSRTYDTTAPTVAMSSAALNPTNTSPIPVTVTFSESVTGFTSGDIVPANGAVSNFAGSGASYTFNLTPAGQGLVTANIAAGVTTDLAGNGNTAATQFSRTYDSVPPTVTMSSAASDPTNASPIPVTVQFSETVTGFLAGDITSANGTANNFSAVDGDTYTFDLTPSGQGLVTANIAAGVATDLAGNGNTIAAQFSRTYTTVYNLFLPLILR